MHWTARLSLLAAMICPLSLAGCGGEASAESGTITELPPVPVGLDAPGLELIVPPDNPLTAAKADLGKKLFFDARLSWNGKVSCSTCHLHEKGWSNGERFSVKANGKRNSRNSPTLYNVGYHTMLYWDGRAPTLEKNILAAWKGHMLAAPEGQKGSTPEAKAEELGAIAGYEQAFRKAFDAAPSGEAIVKALASYVRILRSGNSPWDRYEHGDKSAVSQDAIDGHAIFMGKGGCVACHTPPLYTDRIFHNVGIGMDAENPDLGRYNAIKSDPSIDEATKERMKGAFKTPTLRSVTKSGPYFHDGSAATLEEAVRTMAGGGKDNPHKDPLLADRKLTDEEIGKLLAFLRALESPEPFVPPKLP